MYLNVDMSTWLYNRFYNDTALLIISIITHWCLSPYALYVVPYMYRLEHGAECTA